MFIVFLCQLQQFDLFAGNGNNGQHFSLDHHIFNGAFGNPMLVNQQQHGPLYQGVRSSSTAPRNFSFGTPTAFPTVDLQTGLVEQNGSEENGFVVLPSPSTTRRVAARNRSFRSRRTVDLQGIA
jgi:hypothetical protein